MLFDITPVTVLDVNIRPFLLICVLDVRRYVSQVASMMGCVLSGSLLVVFSLFCYAVCFLERILSLSLHKKSLHAFA